MNLNEISIKTNDKDFVEDLKFLLKNPKTKNLSVKLLHMNESFFKEIFHDVFKNINLLTDYKKITSEFKAILLGSKELYIYEENLCHGNHIQEKLSYSKTEGVLCTQENLLDYINKKEIEKIELTNMIFNMLKEKNDLDIESKMSKYHKVIINFSEENLKLLAPGILLK